MINEILIKKHHEFLFSNSGHPKIIVSKMQTDLDSKNTKEFKSFLYELTREVMNKEFSIENYFQIIEILYKDNSIQIHNFLIDVFWLIGCVLEKKFEGGEDKEIIGIFSNAINHFISKKIFTTENLLEKFQDSSLYYCGLIQDKENFNKKVTRINSKITYEQRKYNIFREESEGFSKLIFLLLNVKLTSSNKCKIIEKLQCLIGFFDLDPSRVLEVILSAFQLDPFNLNFLEIIKIFNRAALPHILGYKLSNQKEEDSDLYTVTAHLIKYDLVELVDIIPYLSQSLEDLSKNYSKHHKDIEEYSKNLRERVNKELGQIGQESATKPNLFVNFNDILSELYANNPESQNSFYRLFASLIKVKSSEKCEILFSLIEKNYDPLKSQELISNICETLSWMIEPIFSHYSLKKIFKKNYQGQPQFNEIMDVEAENFNSNTIISGEFKQIFNVEDFIFTLPKILKYLTLGLAFDQILFTKILIILKANSKHFFEDSNFSNSKKSVYMQIISDLIINVFLPSLSLLDPTPSIVNELWSLISNFDYSKRYEFYHYWSERVYSSHPALFIKHGVVIKEISKWQKSLLKGDQRGHGRILGILSNSNPTVIFDIIIRLLTTYDNLINIFIQTLSFCSNLSYDVIPYIICKLLADPDREKVNEMGELNSKFKYFAYFIGLYFKKFHFADFSGIIYHITNELKSRNYMEIYVLKEILEKMGGMFCIDEMNESAVTSFAGGLNLYLETTDLIRDYKNFKKPNSMLLKFFIKNSQTQEDHKDNQTEPIINLNSFGDQDKCNTKISFTSFLLILMGIRKQNIIFNSNLQKPKSIGYLYDHLQNVYVQLMNFLLINTDRINYAKLIPNWRLEKYVINYNLPPENIFYLVRNKISPLFDMIEQEYSDLILQYSSVLDSYLNLNKKCAEENYESLYIQKGPFLDELYKEIWKYISPQLYFIFWSLQLKDIYAPINIYEKEIEKNKKDIEKSNDDTKIQEQARSKKDIEKLYQNIKNLENEKINSIKYTQKIYEFLESKKELLLDDMNIPKTSKREISKYLIQYCLYPRLIISKVDAIYAAKMLILLINLKIQNLNLFDIMQKLVKFLIPCMICLSESEAQNLGVFLLELLKQIKIWQDETVWETECYGNPSFSGNLDTASQVELSDFKKVILVLLSKMNLTFINIFGGNDFMSTRNALIILFTINSIYPSTKEIANDILEAIEVAIEKFTEYEDLKLMMTRFKDILNNKRQHLPSENEITDIALKEKNEKEISAMKSNGSGLEKKKKKSKEREKEKEKKKDESAIAQAKVNEIKKRSPEDFRGYRKR